jgi:hypothetical protein
MTDDDVIMGNDGTTSSRWLATVVKSYMTAAVASDIAALEAEDAILTATTAGTASSLFDLQNVVTALALSTSNTRTASYTFVLGDGAIPFVTVVMNVATANTLTIPLNSSVAFPIGTILAAEQWGAGLTTWTPATAGVTINSRGGLRAMGGQWAAASARKTATDTWLLSGDLA